MFLPQVYSTNYNGGDIKVVLNISVHNVQNLAVDWINFKLYVLEVMVERIDACDFDGANRVTLVAENLQTPHGLALDPTVGCVFTEACEREKFLTHKPNAHHVINTRLKGYEN